MGWSIPDTLDAWYLVAGADEVRGRVRPFAVGAVQGAVARTPAGLVALDAVCPHMGADLRLGHVVGDRIVCPLHGMGFGADGRCDRRNVPSARTVPVGEACGAVFVHPGSSSAGRLPVGSPPGSAPRSASPGPLPSCDRWPDEDFVWASARAFRVPVPWRTVLVNAFDLHHLDAVHHRALVRPPVFDEPAPDRLRMRYATRVVGSGLSDRLTRLLASDRVDLWLTSVGGPVMTVEVDLGRTRTAAVVGVVPDGEGTWLRLAVGVPRGFGGALRARLARWLYVTFLRQDIPVLQGVELAPHSDLPEDEPVQRLLAFLDRRSAV